MKNVLSFIFLMLIVAVCFGQSQKWAVRTPIESANFAALQEDYSTFKAHEGKKYFSCDTITLGAADSSQYFFETPAADTLIHGMFYYSMSKEGSVGIYKDVDRDTVQAGDTITAENYNFSKTDSSQAFLTWGRKVVEAYGTFVGAQIYDTLGTQGTVELFGGEAVFKASTGYMIDFRSLVAGNKVSVNFVYYED